MAALARVSGLNRSATVDQQAVSRVVDDALVLALDTSRSFGARAELLAGLAGHDRSVMGRAWLSLVVPALRGGNSAAVMAERLLAATLESEAGLCGPAVR
jgi:hypothetical protein